MANGSGCGSKCGGTFPFTITGKYNNDAAAFCRGSNPLLYLLVKMLLPLLWLRGQGSGWLLVPAAAVSLATFAWLLTLHAAPSGRVYAAYGGVYVAVALAWLWSVDGVRPSIWDGVGVVVTLAGMAIIAYQPRA